MENILDDFKDDFKVEVNYKLATKGQRFANYIIDGIGYFLLALLVGVILGMFLVGTENEYLLEETETISSKIMEWLWGTLLITIYYTALEYLLKGKSLGKYLTKTRAITIDNGRMDFETSLIRSVCRVIPFDALSFLGDNSTGWHDSLSKTKVIQDENWYESEMV